MRIAVPLPIASPLRRLGVNSFWLLLARVSAQVLSFVLTALIARRMGAAVLGEYALVASIVYLANVATTFGTDSLLIRELGRTRTTDLELVPTAFWLQVGLSVLFIATTVVWNNGDLALPLYSLSLLPLAVYSVYSAVLRGFERMELFLLLNLASAVLTLIAGLVVLFAGGDLVALLAALTVAQGLTAVLAWRLSRPFAPPVRRFLRIPSSLKPTLTAALPFALLMSSAVAFQRMGILVLGVMGGSEATGWFSAASRLLEGLKIAPQALLGALLPMMALHSASAGAGRLYQTSLRFSVGFCLVTAALLTAFAAPLVNAIYGDGFAPASQALSILAWGLVPFAVSSNISVRLIAAEREWMVLVGTVASLALALGLYFLLLPRYGLSGACWASVLAEIGQAGVFWVLKKKAIS